MAKHSHIDISSNVKSLQKRFWKKVAVTSADDCWLWIAGKDRHGYGRINVGGQFGHPVFAHRVSWQLARGAIPDHLLVCHKCDQPSCVNPSHLFLGTHAENTRDMMAKDRHPRGERAPHSRLKESDIIKIRQMSADGIKQQTIADIMGLTQPYISLIVHRRVWNYLP